MSATIGAALKKVAVALLLDKKNWEKIACLLLAVFMIVFFPAVALAAVTSMEDVDFTSPEVQTKVILSLTEEQIDELTLVEDTVKALHTAMSGRTPEQIKAAEVLYVLALSEYAKEPGFVAKLAGCFADDQTDQSRPGGLLSHHELRQPPAGRGCKISAWQRGGRAILELVWVWWPGRVVCLLCELVC